MEHLWLTRAPGHVTCHPDRFGYRTEPSVVDAPAQRHLRVDEDTRVDLRVGSGRHQVAVAHQGRQWVETVDVVEGTASGLPVLGSVARPTPFASQVETGCTVTEHSVRGLRQELRRLWETLQNAPLALAVQDPEEPSAVTALTCHVDLPSRSLLWRTWRVLPEAGFVLRTRAELLFSTTTARAAA